ncbi:unnamed protein product, partial [marine sediment metagenome]
VFTRVGSPVYAVVEVRFIEPARNRGGILV